jgi:hypothetical protein
VHFRVVFGHFPCGIQGKALEEPGYFRQRGSYSNSEPRNLSLIGGFRKRKKGRLGLPLLFFSVPPCLRGKTFPCNQFCRSAGIGKGIL